MNTQIRIFTFFLFLIFLPGCNSKVQNIFSERSDPFRNNTQVGPGKDGNYYVPTAQIINSAGMTVLFPGRPTDLSLTPDEKLLVVKNKSSLVFIDVLSQTIMQTLPLPKGGNTFVGIAWSSDGKSVWNTDSKGYLRMAQMGEDGKFSWKESIPLPGPVAEKNLESYPGGIYLDEKNGWIYVALSRNNSLGLVNLKTKQLEEQVPVGIAPYTVVVHQSKAYVTNWGGRVPGPNDMTGPSSESRVVIDPKTGVASSGTVSVVSLETRKTIKEIPVHLHPSGMTLSADGNYLWVANANSDLISVIDTRTDQVVKSIDTKPMPDLPFGSTPNALTVDPSGKTLYVANGGNNHLAVIDLARNTVIGLIPTGWYPGAVILNKKGTHLFVANVKGIGSRDSTRNKQGLNSNFHMGSISIIPVPDKATLDQYTIRAAINMRLPKITEIMNIKAVKERSVPIPTHPGEKSVFKHVLYIIKENRTYDQVFGDLPKGNGDSTLCQFNRKVTPNHHALAEKYVLLDNTYCNGVLSADGHQWATEGYVTDYLEKSFGDFVRSYPYEGEDALAFAPNGFIWDQILKAGLTFRDYGEFVTADIEPEKATWQDLYEQYKSGTDKIKIKANAALHTLRPYLCPTFVGFPSIIPDVYRAKEFINELEQFEKNGALPNFMIMLLPNDHTSGTREGYPTPRASVADNDLALGQIVEAISKSKFWKETAIFVIQDDPQAGLDHVDGHRTVAFCISPYTKRGQTISTHYNQNSILRTIELIFGLNPMSQFDLIAEPMTDCFTDQPDFSSYQALPNQIPLNEMNPSVKSLSGKQRYYARKSMELPLDEVDQADETIFNRIIWHSVKGYNVPYPKIKNRNGDTGEK